MKQETKIKWMLSIGTLLLMAGIIYINWDAVKKLIDKAKSKWVKEPDTSAPSNPTNNSSSNPISVLDGNKVLSKGSKGAEVLALQQGLNKFNKLMGNKKFSPALVEDGSFGSLTMQALQACAGVSTITLNQAFTMLKNSF